jgi:ParB family chromosome partitioning protein
MTQPKRRGLGRGLDALLKSTELPVAAEPLDNTADGTPMSPTAAAGQDAGGVLWVAVDRIRPNPYQPRQTFDTEALEELAASIRSHGLIQPLLVAPGEDGYTLIAGERRWQASRLAGLLHVPVVTRQASAQEMLALAIIENVQRENLDPLEAATSYQRLIEEFGLTQAEVASLVGKSRVAITNTVRLLGLPEDLRLLVSGGHLSEGHARAILGLQDPLEQQAMAQRTLAEGWTVRRVEEAVRQRQASLQGKTKDPERGEPRRPNPADPDTASAASSLEAAFGTRVEIRRRGRGGQILFHFYSEEDLAALYRALTAGR